MFKEILIPIFLLISITNAITIYDEYQNSTKFTFDFYRQAYNENENFVMSPISFRILLSLVYQSSFNVTEAELQEKMYFNTKEEAYELQKLSLDALKSSPFMKLVNHIFLKNTSQLNDQFAKQVEKYGSGVELIDFTDKRASANRMNSWVEEQTNGMIKNLVSEKVISDDTALFLLNTIYFKAQWKNPFNKNSVRDSKFHAIDGKDYDIKFMNDMDNYMVGEVNSINSEVLEIPYVNGSNFKFWIILPNTGETVTNVVSKLTTEVFDEIIKSFHNYPYSVSVPLFEIESGVDGKKLLKEYGLTSIFELHELDMLTGDELKVDDARQKTKIIVNTDGTEASTATYIKGVSRSLRPSFVANRPFIFAVVSSITNEPVFIGHFVKP